MRRRKRVCAQLTFGTRIMVVDPPVSILEVRGWLVDSEHVPPWTRIGGAHSTTVLLLTDYAKATGDSVDVVLRPWTRRLESRYRRSAF